MATFKLFNNHVKIPFVLLAIVEGTVFFTSVFIASAIRYRTLDFSSTETLFGADNIVLKAGVFAVVHLLCMTALGQYQRENYRGNNNFLRTLARMVVSMLLASVILIVIFYVIPATTLGRGVSSLAVLLSFACVVTLRQVFFHTIDGNFFVSKVLVFGTGKRAADLLAYSEDADNRSSYRIMGFISTPSQAHIIPQEKIIGLDKCLLAQARKLDVNEIILALDDRRKEYPTQHLLECKMNGITITDPVSFLEREQGKVNLKMMNPSWMIYSDGFTTSKLKDFLARAFDIVSSLSILILMSPVLLITALLIFLEGGMREPVFYRQTRVGKNGKLFDLLKFRSMSVNAEVNGAQWALVNDARVTRVGSIIRKFRIDELPQILNILNGDMRLVGPRPERPEFVSKLSESIDMYNQRHAVKPGLAGWAQLKYPYGASEEDAYEKLQYDLFYIKNSNLVMDFFILIQTLEVVIFGKGAR